MANPQGRRNVLLITGDQWRGDCLSAVGHPLLRTPHLDALAADGALLMRHYANAVPCGPSRACLLTGMYLQNHRSVRNGTPLDPRHTNLALEARAAGRAPVLFGYTDTSVDPRGRPPADPALRTYESVMAGFDPVVSMTETIEPWAEHLRARGYAVPDEPQDIYRSAGGTFGPAAYRAQDSDTAFMADRVLAWLEGRRGEPWFAHVVFVRPHPPWVVPVPYDTLYDPAATPPPLRAATQVEEAAQHPWLAHKLATLTQDDWLCGARLDPRGLAGSLLGGLRAAYYALITEVDAHIGRLVQHLKDTGQYDDTLIVFTADHGEMLGDHWLLGKETFHDEAYHVPMIVRAPGLPPSRRIDAFTEHVDVMPTILEWLGLKPPRQCDGRSLLPLLRGSAPADWRGHAHWEFDFRDLETGSPEAALGLSSDECTLDVLRGERTKYVHFTALPPLFFDLEADPGQLVDRAGDPAYAPQVLAHAQALLSWRMRHDERTLTHFLLRAEGMIEQRLPDGLDPPEA